MDHKLMRTLLVVWGLSCLPIFRPRASRPQPPSETPSFPLSSSSWTSVQTPLCESSCVCFSLDTGRTQQIQRRNRWREGKVRAHRSTFVSFMAGLLQLAVYFLYVGSNEGADGKHLLKGTASSGVEHEVRRSRCTHVECTNRFGCVQQTATCTALYLGAAYIHVPGSMFPAAASCFRQHARDDILCSLHW